MVSWDAISCCANPGLECRCIYSCPAAKGAYRQLLSPYHFSWTWTRARGIASWFSQLCLFVRLFGYARFCLCHFDRSGEPSGGTESPHSVPVDDSVTSSASGANARLPFASGSEGSSVVVKRFRKRPFSGPVAISLPREPAASPRPSDFSISDASSSFVFVGKQEPFLRPSPKFACWPSSVMLQDGSGPVFRRELAPNRVDGFSRPASVRPRRSEPSGTPLPPPFFALRGLPERFEPVKPLPVPAYGSARDYSTPPSASSASSAVVAASAATSMPSRGSLLQVLSSSSDPGSEPTSSRPRFCPGSAPGVVLQSEIHERRWKKIFLIWQDLEPHLVPHSSLLQGLATSRFRDLLRQRLLMHCQDTTVLRYFGSILRFLLAASDLDFSISSITQLQVVDVMFSLAASGDDDAAPDTLELPHNMLKALRWMVKTLGLDTFPPLVGLFASVLAFSAKDRREAPPLALDFVLCLEQLELRSGTPAADRIGRRSLDIRMAA